MSQEWPIKFDTQSANPANNLEEKPGEKKEEPKIETELSPEIMEMIMNKVQDIDKDGVAFSSISGQEGDLLAKFSSILRNGLLGSMSGDGRKNSKEEWERHFKKHKRGMTKWLTVHFNIVGRSLFGNIHNSLSKNKTEPEETEIGNSFWSGRNSLSLIFDISKFTEDMPAFTSRSDFYPEKKHAYRPVINSPVQEIPIEKRRTVSGELMVDTMYGFVISPRISPRLFQGIVYKLEKDESYEENIRKASLTMNDVYREQQDKLLPIYDEKGDLLWPKKMSYEEVKKFVEDRDKNKQEKLDSESSSE